MRAVENAKETVHCKMVLVQHVITVKVYDTKNQVTLCDPVNVSNYKTIHMNLVELLNTV